MITNGRNEAPEESVHYRPGASSSAPLHLDVETEDAGYGDMRMRKNGELVVVSYHGLFAQVAVKQYVIELKK